MDYKVVFTTHLERICSQMHAQKIVRVKPLGLDDSWALFSDIVGEEFLKENSEIHDIAKEIVDKCGRVPKILIKCAHEMASKTTIQEWNNGLESLKRPLIDLQEEIIDDDIIANEEDEDENTTTLGAKAADTNVFGSPITNKTVRELPEYAGGRQIANRDRAAIAVDMEAKDDKHVKAREYVNWLKMKYKDGFSTIGLFYNATGSTLIFSGSKDWRGYFIEGLYPKKVENGQWGVFVHMNENSLADHGGSSGAIAYSGENASGAKCDWMLAWDNASVKKQARTKVFTEAREQNHFNYCWPTIYDLLSKSGRHRRDTWGGCLSEISIEKANGPFFTARLSLDSDW